MSPLALQQKIYSTIWYVACVLPLIKAYNSDEIIQMDEEGHEPLRPKLEVCALDGQTAIFVCSMTLLHSLAMFF